MTAADDLVLARQDRLAELLADDRTPTRVLARAAADYAAAVAAAVAAAEVRAADPSSCPDCGHARHGEVCLNMASDNDCECQAGRTPVAGVAFGQPRAFVLRRDRDVSGVSGTGVVAQGVEFADGTVALRWLVLPDSPTSVVFHDNGVESVERVHGHDGSTVIEWADPADEAFANRRRVFDEEARGLWRQPDGREEIAREVEALAQNRDPAHPRRSRRFSDACLHIADRIRHPERYSGVAQGQGGQAVE